MLEINNIEKSYARHKALDNVSLRVHKGSIFGLLGPNGAGKTSLIRIINQITAPDHGEIWFDGERLNPSHTHRIGYLPEERGLYKKMRIGEQLLYLAQLKGLPKDEASRRIKHWFEKMEIQTWWNKKTEDLSKGMQQKVQFVATVVHQPDLIILDEPFTGFDPVNADLIKNEILALNKAGATIIFSTHRMDSVEELCDHIALIHQSQKILDGCVEEIRQSYRSNSYRIIYESTGETVPLFNTDLFTVERNEQQQGQHAITVKIADGRAINDVLSFLIPMVTLVELKEVIPRMHDIFVQTVTSATHHPLKGETL